MSADPIQGNQAKYRAYRLAHARMKAAIDAGFPLEAVAIAESIVTDRLLSYVNFHGAGFDPERSTLGQVAQKAAKICRDLTDTDGETLAVKSQRWAKARNAVLHAIAKSGQGVGPAIPAERFVDHALEVGRQGVELVAEVKAWHRKQLRHSARRS